MRLPFHLRLVTWFLLASYLNLLCPVGVLCAELPVLRSFSEEGDVHAVNPSSPPETSAAANHQPPTANYKFPPPNRTLPSGVVQSIPAVEFLPVPTDEQIFRAGIFPEPLVPLGQSTTPTENAALAQAITRYLQPGAGGDLTPFTDFLTKYPQSAWAASLHLNLGLRYFATAFFSKAFAEYAAAWDSSKAATDQHGRAVGDRSIAELLRLNARLGRYEALEKLFKEIGGRPFHGNTMELVAGARAGLALMQQHPEDAFRCGPAALDRILAHQSKTVGFNAKLMASRSSLKGMSLTEVWKLAREVGLDYQMAKREPGAVVIAPAVVNWKVGHYAALLSFDHDVGQLEDPTFGPNAYFATRAALDTEASGYFLVPAGPLPAGWQPVGEDEGNTVWGKGTTTADDSTRTRPYDKKTCTGGGGGMAVASAMLMTCGLNLMDTPLFYAPPKGPSIDFTLTYNQWEASQPTTINYGNVGNQWTHGWLSFIDEVQSGSAGSYTYTPSVRLMGGGTEPYPASASTADTDLGVSGSYDFSYQTDSHVHLVKTDANTYTQTNPDGSVYIYGFRTGAVGQRRYFLTQIIDPSRNALTLTYDASARLVAVTDALGQVTTLSYNLASDPLKLTQVTDPFGRSAQLSYNANGQLSRITDMLGLSSQFTYSTDGSDFITSLTTPYGTSNFAYGVNGRDRWLTMTDPLGNTERVEYHDSVGTYPAVGVQPAGMNTDNTHDNYRNTFYWDKLAYASWPDVTAAHDYHWMHYQINETSGDLENEKSAMENNRVWYNYPGQNPSTPYYDGTSGSPSAIGRVLDDGTTQLYQYTYNSFGKVLTSTDPLGRVTTYTYDQTNGIDLMEIDQATGTGGQHDVLGKFTYNSQHLPLTATDASGQVTTYSYNTAGQVSTITDAKNEVTSFYYDLAGAANTTDLTKTGYLVAVQKTLDSQLSTFTAVTLTYDGFGRVRTVTDSEGYTVTTDYDVFNRPMVVTYPDGTTTQNVYDKLDLAQQIDRRGRVTKYRHNALRQLAIATDPLDRRTVYDWCGCGSLLSLTDPAGDTTAWTYDVQGRQTSKIYPDQTSESYTYEATTSRLKSVTDAKSQVTSYKYNLDNSLQQVSYTDTSGNPLNPATPTVSYTYDPNYQRIASMTDGIGTTSYTYNPIPATPTLGSGLLSSVAGPLPNSTISYSYDELGRVVNEAHSGTVNGSPTTVNSISAYDALGRVTSATNPLGTFGYTYVNQTGRVAQIAYPNGQVTNYSYYPNSSATPGNDDQRLQSISNLVPLSSQPSTLNNLSSFTYSYDAEGIIQTWSKQIDAATALTSNFTYDSADRLIVASVPLASRPSPQAFHYIYDKAGNRTSEQIDSGVAAATVNNLNQVTALSSTGPIHFAGGLSEPANVTVNGVSAKLDANNNFSADVPLAPGAHNVPVVATDGNGNTTTKTYQVTVTDSGVNRTLTYDANRNLTNDGNGKTYAYDAANRMVSITQASGVTGFVYNGLGQRVQETLNGTLIKQWVWCGGAEPCEERDGSNNVTKRFYSQGEQINGAPFFFTYDHLGSVREMTDGTGTIRARYGYDPYGRMTKLSGDLDADFGFQGMYYHAASGLSLTYYRAYDPVLGRWTTPDPAGEVGGINLFQFVGNNPISRTDPFGLWWAPKGYGKSGFAPPSPGKDFAIGAGIGAVPLVVIFAPEIVAGAGATYEAAGATTARVLANPVAQRILLAGLLAEAGTGAADWTDLGDPLDDIAQSTAENFSSLKDAADYLQLTNIIHSEISLIGDELDETFPGDTQSSASSNCPHRGSRGK